MVVVALNVENHDVRHILIDNESLADVLYFKALLKIGISPNRLTRVNTPLVGFIGDTIQVEGMISLTKRMRCYLL